jgi:hypothetical protein
MSCPKLLPLLPLEGLFKGGQQNPGEQKRAPRVDTALAGEKYCKVFMVAFISTNIQQFIDSICVALQRLPSLVKEGSLLFS